MYRCEECGTIFEEPNILKENLGVLGGDYAILEHQVCPFCKIDGCFEEIEPCKICGSYENDKDGEYCKECISDVTKRFQFFLADFTEEELDILRELNLEEMI